MSLFEIKCPMCKGTLWIDPASGKVVDHKSSDQQKANFDDFLKARQKGTAWDDKMKKAKEEEAKRRAEIEMKFNVAKNDKTDRTETDQFKTPLDWD
jgi:hypothetical protein